MSFSLNGWRRLWLLLTAISAVVVTVFAYFNFPVADDIPSSSVLIDRLSPEHQALLKGFIPDDGLKVKAPNGHILAFRQGVSESQSLPVVKAYTEIVQVELDKLSERRTHLIVVSFAAWLLLVIATYSIGEGIAWVRRGFKDASISS